MSKVIKFTGIVIAALAGLLILAVIVINVIPGEKFKSFIASAVQNATGRELMIEGDLDISLFTTLAVKTSDIKFANAAWGTRPHMVSIDRIEGAVALFPLLRGILDVSLVVDNPDLLMEINESGEANWQFSQPDDSAAAKDEEPAEDETAPDTGGLPIRPLIRKLHINGLRIAYADGVSGDRIALNSDDLHLDSAQGELTINLNGQINNTPLSLSGGLDNHRFFVENRPAGLDLTGALGAVQLTIKGTVGPLAPAFDLDTAVTLKADSVQSFAVLERQKLPDIGPLSLSARLAGKKGKYALSDLLATLHDEKLTLDVTGDIADLATLDGLRLEAGIDTRHLTVILNNAGYQPENPLPDIFTAAILAEGNREQLALKTFKTTIKGEGLKATVDATMDDLITLKGIQADLAVELASLGLISEIAGTELPALGPVEVTAAVSSPGREAGPLEFKTAIDSQAIHAHLTGSAANLRELKGVQADVNLDVDSLAWLADYLQLELPPLGPLKASAAIVSRNDTLAANDIKVDLAGNQVKVHVAGAVDDLIKLKGVQADLDLGVQSLAALSQVARVQLPDLGPLKASAGIVSKGDSFELTKLKADLTGDKARVNLDGSVDDLIKLKGIQADLDIEVQSLADFSQIAGVTLPALGPLTASAGIVSKDDTFALTDLKAHLTGKDAAADLAGSVDDLLKFKGIKADLDLEVQSLADFSQIAGVALPALGPLSASAAVASKGDTFELSRLKADLAGEKIRASVAASADDILKLVGINTELDVKVSSLADLGSLIDQELPASGPVSLAAEIVSKEGLQAPAEISVTLASDGVNANLSGGIADLLKARGIDLALVVEADSMQQVGRLTGGEFTGTEPLKLTSRFSSGERTYQLADLQLNMGQLAVKGQAAFEQPADSAGRPRISGELHVGDLDLGSDQGQTESPPAAPGVEEEAQPEKSEKKDKLFPATPLPLAPLKSMDADVKLTVAKLTTRQLLLEDLHATLALNNGLLKLAPAKARVGQGTFDGTLALDARSTPPQLTTDIEITDATFRKFGGKVHFLANLTGSGDSVAAIMAGLDGQLEVDVQDATLKKSLMTGFGAGLLDKLNPFSQSEETTELECAIVFFNIEDGMADADKRIAMQMTDVTWLGSGEINLKTEEIDFGINPKTRKILDISVGSLAKLVHVGGTLAEPKVQLDPKDVAVKYGKYTAAMATGGLTLAADMIWGRIKANQNICDKILQDLESELEEGKKKTAE